MKTWSYFSVVQGLDKLLCICCSCDKTNCIWAAQLSVRTFSFAGLLFSTYIVWRMKYDWQLVYMDAIINWNIPLHTDWVVIAFWESSALWQSLKWELLLIWMLVSKDDSRSVILTNICVKLTIHFSVDGLDQWSLILLLVTSGSLEENYSRKQCIWRKLSFIYWETFGFNSVKMNILSSFSG